MTGIGLPETTMAETDEEIIAAIREDAFQAAVKTSALQHHRVLGKKLMPHLEAIMNAIDGLS